MWRKTQALSLRGIIYGLASPRRWLRSTVTRLSAILWEPSSRLPIIPVPYELVCSYLSLSSNHSWFLQDTTPITSWTKSSPPLLKLSLWENHMGLLHFTKAINLECYRWPCFFAICRKLISNMRRRYQHTAGKNWDAGWRGSCQHFKHQLCFLQRPSCLLAFPDLPWYSNSIDSIRYPRVLPPGWPLCFS